MSFSQFLMTNWPYTIAIIVLIGILMVIEARFGGSKSGLTPQNAIKVINHKKSMVIDMRSATEFGKGHIARAKNMSLAEIKALPPLLKKQKTHPILLVCERGMQTRTASDWLTKQGFDTVYQLNGGMTAWRKEKLPTEKETS